MLLNNFYRNETTFLSISNGLVIAYALNVNIMKHLLFSIDSQTTRVSVRIQEMEPVLLRKFEILCVSLQYHA